MHAHDAASAIRSLERASRFDLAVGGVGFNAYFGALYPIYLRGQAYLAANEPDKAAGEFQRILDHRSIVHVDPMGAMARLQLARALARSGEAAKAMRAYDGVLALWQDANPDLAIVKTAKAERARLQ